MQNIVIIESPFSGDIDKNIRYAQQAMNHSRENGEIPIVPHLMWTQHHLAPNYFVSDYDAKFTIKNCGRDVSLEQIKVLRRLANKVIFYVDNGYSSGMKLALEHCKEENIQYEERTLFIEKNQIINANSS